MKAISYNIEKLQLFQNITLSKQQWEVILKGCDFPKSTLLWTVLRESILVKLDSYPLYTLISTTKEEIEKAVNKYKELNNQCVKAYYNKKKKEKEAKERCKSFRAFTLYMVGGVLTTEKPSFE